MVSKARRRALTVSRRAEDDVTAIDMTKGSWQPSVLDVSASDNQFAWPCWPAGRDQLWSMPFGIRYNQDAVFRDASRENRTVTQLVFQAVVHITRADSDVTFDKTPIVWYTPFNSDTSNDEIRFTNREITRNGRCAETEYFIDIPHTRIRADTGELIVGMVQWGNSDVAASPLIRRAYAVTKPNAQVSSPPTSSNTPGASPTTESPGSTTTEPPGDPPGGGSDPTSSDLSSGGGSETNIVGNSGTSLSGQQSGTNLGAVHNPGSLTSGGEVNSSLPADQPPSSLDSGAGEGPSSSGGISPNIIAVAVTVPTVVVLALLAFFIIRRRRRRAHQRHVQQTAQHSVDLPSNPGEFNYSSDRKSALLFMSAASPHSTSDSVLATTEREYPVALPFSSAPRSASPRESAAVSPAEEDSPLRLQLFSPTRTPSPIESEPPSVRQRPIRPLPSLPSSHDSMRTSDNPGIQELYSAMQGAGLTPDALLARLRERETEAWPASPLPQYDQLSR